MTIDPFARMSHVANVPRSPFWWSIGLRVNAASPKMRTSLNNAQFESWGLLLSHMFTRCCCAICCQSNQEHWGEPLRILISALGSFKYVTQHTGQTALRPIRRTKCHGFSVLLMDTGVTTGIRTHTLLIRNTRVWIRCSCVWKHQLLVGILKSVVIGSRELARTLDFRNSATYITS